MAGTIQHSPRTMVPHEALARTPVGASHTFDPGSDGLTAIYATRILDRGLDPRALNAEIRADRLGAPERGAVNRALMERARMSRFGRGTAAHLQVSIPPKKALPAVLTPRPQHRRELSARHSYPRWSRRLVAAGLALLVLVPIGVIAANAQELPLQSRYIVQEGDTLDGIATEFGVDPEAILAASAIQDPPYLTPEEVIVIPDPTESPDAAALNAAERSGSSPFVVGAHDVAPGETLAGIASAFAIDPTTLATFNGVVNVESLIVGQRLLIPLTDALLAQDDQTSVPAETLGSAETFEAVGGLANGWGEQSSEPVIATHVPAYMQAYSLSCEYAAAFIATSAFGSGVPESAFMERIGQAANPHWGYRGDITGTWGGTDDYGVYPEALVPTLNEFGFAAEVFYGSDPSSLTARLDAGMPVMTWLGYFGDNAWQQTDEGSYLLAPGMHVVTVYGYDDGGVYLANPGRGTLDFYGWSEFLTKWRVLGGMAMAVTPM